MPEDTVRRNIVLPADLDRRLRDAIYARSGLKKGDISAAIVEAVELWLRQTTESDSSKTKDQRHP